MKKIIVVGSGAGGAELAKELAIKGADVTLIEKGPCTEPGEAYRQYHNLDTDVEVLKTECVGGSTMVSAGNAVRTLEKVLLNYKVDIVNELDQIERELEVKALPDSLMGPGTKSINKAALDLGFPLEKMPKFIDPHLCKPCGKCVLSCPRNAKWTAQEFVKKASHQGARIINNRMVTEVIHQNDEVKGVKCNNHEYYADQVVLSAGAIETARLLQNTGIKAGEQLFVDTFVTVGGVREDVGFNEEISMFSLIRKKDLILSPHYTGLLIEPMQQFNARESDILGMMIKIKDDNQGIVTSTSAVKYNTARDAGLLASGAAMAGAILTEAGVNPNTLISTRARGAHPGGTAAMGRVVDHNLETEIEGLFVADASVLPEAPGAPPILTILALSKRLAHYLAGA